MSEKVIAKVPIFEGMETNVKVVNGELVVTTYEKEKLFPKLMKLIRGDFYILMIKKDCGLLVKDATGEGEKFHYSNRWDMTQFEDYNGTVEIDSETLKKIYEYGRN